MRFKLSARWITLGLSLLGVGGVGATSWLAVKCHDKARDKTEKKDKLIAYAPAIVCGVGTSACILGSHYLSRKEIVALTGTCTYLAANRDKILKTVKEKYGIEEAKKLQAETTQLPAKQKSERNWEKTGDGLEKFMDGYTGRCFLSSFSAVVDAGKKLNYDFHSGMYVSLNDYYRYLGLTATVAGEEFGWPANEEYYDWNIDEPIMFDYVPAEDENGDRMFVIYICTEPMQAWMEV